jgi:23S rRNA (adenine2503-C2)-methyltransferase
MQQELKNIKELTLPELEKTLTGLGLRKYRAGQVMEWIYRHHARAFEAMTNIAKADRDLLTQRFSIPTPGLLRTEQSSDGTRKFLFGLQDGHTIESVLIPDEERNTLCISSQVGCAQACRFCLTGSGGFRRDLEAFEIADQVLMVDGMLASEAADPATGWTKRITNIVLMGMGEPLANLDNVLRALQVITAEKGLAFSPRRVTVSTDGLVPGIDSLGRSGMKVNLAVSLNATTDEVRDVIMPVNRRFPIKELLVACRRFPLDPRRRITFEYVLLRGVNDSREDALRLTRLLRGIRSKVNLIPFNPFPGSEFQRPDDGQVRRFQQVLLDHGYTAPVRESRGSDISAACGQLREKTGVC